MKSNQPFARSLRTMVRGAQVTVFLLVAAQSHLIFAEELELGTGEPQTLEEAFFGGQVKLNVRARAEIADQDGLQTSQAYTERIRLGYGSRTYNGLSFYVELEDIRTLDDDRYNAAGSNANPLKTAIADPEDTELNQGYLKYDWKDSSTQLTFGRQRIILDDARFVGNVGWRQNEQTFDAATIASNLSDDIKLIYSFVWDVNRIFGDEDSTPAAGKDFDSESHFVNLTLSSIPVVGKVTLFAYLLDFNGVGGLSRDTFGVRFAGKSKSDDGTTLGYIFSYAKQVDSNDNTVNSENDYFLGEVKLSHGKCQAGVGYEMLGSDKHGTVAFVTPLATGHKFNGWADSFLATPADGLQDAYVFAGTKLPGNVSAKIVYHWFWTEEGGGDLGDELDIVLKKPLSKRATAVAKYARYNGVGNAAGGKGPTSADRNKFWLQFEYKF